jgi:hypothetical protein
LDGSWPSATDVVGNYAEGHIAQMRLAPLAAGHFLQGGNQGLKNVGVVVGLLALNHLAKAFESHARVHVLGGKFLQGTVGLAQKFHEDVVPNLNHAGVVVVDQLCARDSRAVSGGPHVYVDLRTRTARTRIPHFPKIVFFGTVQNAVLGNVFFPNRLGLLVRSQSVGGIASKNRHVQLVRVDFVDLGQKLPGPSNGVLFEVIAKTPVPEHLEQRMVVGVVPDFLQIVVLARHPQAFLRVRNPRMLHRRDAQEHIFERIHAGIGEQQGGVVLDDQRCGWYNRMPFGGKKIKKSLSDLARGHVCYLRSFKNRA